VVFDRFPGTPILSVRDRSARRVLELRAGAQALHDQTPFGLRRVWRGRRLRGIVRFTGRVDGERRGTVAGRAPFVSARVVRREHQRRTRPVVGGGHRGRPDVVDRRVVHAEPVALGVRHVSTVQRMPENALATEHYGENGPGERGGRGHRPRGGGARRRRLRRVVGGRRLSLKGRHIQRGVGRVARPRRRRLRFTFARWPFRCAGQRAIPRRVGDFRRRTGPKVC